MQEGYSKARLDLQSGERFISLRQALGLSSFGFNQIILQPGQRGRIHRHEFQEEVYLVLEGELSVLIEGQELRLQRGELLRVAPALRRQLVNRGQQKVAVLALGGRGEHQGRDGEAFSSWDQEHGGPPQEIPAPSDLDPGELRS